MSGYTPSAGARAALGWLVRVAEDEDVPDSLLSGAGDLDPEYRKAWAVLRACAAERGAAPATHEMIPSRFEPGMKPVRPFNLAEWSMNSFKPAEPPAPEPQEPSTPQVEAATGRSSAALQKDEQPAVPIDPPPSPSLLAVRQTVTLRNARAGEDYSDTLVLEGGRDVRLEDAGGSGLRFDPDDWVFSGVPEAAGDYELKLSARIDDRPAEIIARLAVIPDPKSLWTSLPSDQNAPFAKPDEHFQLLEGEHLRLVAASKRGRSHAKSGGFREDDLALAVHGSWHIAAVADGAGSAPLSRRGSRLAVEIATRELPTLIDQHLEPDLEDLIARPEGQRETAERLYKVLATAAFTAADALQKQAEQLSEPPASLSTTLILVIARRFAARWFVAAFSIGDGGAALLDLEAKAVQPLTMPDSGEFAGQTRFLAKAEFAEGAAAQRLRFATPERFTAIALMTDGITDPKLPTDKLFADPAAWEEFWSGDLAKSVDFGAPEEQLREQFLAWLDFWSPGNHDDRTIAVLLPREGA